MFVKTLSILVACALVQASSGLEIPERYMNMPLKAKDMQGGNFDYYMIKGLKLDADTKPEEILKQLEELTSGAKLADGTCSSDDYSKGAHLKWLADGLDGCSFNSANELLAFYQVYKATDKSNHPEAMLNFLEHYGRIKFPGCAVNIIKKIKKDLDRFHRYFDWAEYFLRLAMSMQDASDEEFFEALKQFKPLESPINVDNLAPLSDRTETRVKAADRIQGEFNIMCKGIFRVADFDMESLNLADFFAPEAKYFEKEPKLAKLNEMNRICNEGYKNEAFLENLKKVCKPEHDSMYPE